MKTINIEKLISKYIPLLFYLSIILIRIPPFYLVPLLRTGLLTTHTLSRVIVLFITSFIVYKTTIKKENLSKILEQNNNLFLLFFIFTFFQSLSVINAKNLSAFIYRYKDIIFPGFYLLIALYLKKTITNYSIVKLILTTSLINFALQIFMFINPSIFVDLGGFLIYDKHFEIVKINLERGRIFIETYDEIFIPLIFAIFNDKKTNKKLLPVFFVILSLPSLLSNFRSRVIMFLIATLGSLIILTGKKIFLKIAYFLISFLTIYFSIFILNNVLGFSFLDRFLLQNTREDVNTIESRYKNFNNSFEMGKAFPLFGVGLGNYYDYLPGYKNVNFSIFGWVNKEAQIAATNPHNIVAQIVSETGFLSLFFYIFIIIKFMYQDFKIIFYKEKNMWQKTYIISFWSLFIYSIFNPTTTLTYNCLFWLIRIMI